MTYDARAIANYLLDYAEVKKEKVSLLSLLKIIYYANGWYLIKFERPLVRQRFEAWKNGPVVRVVWESFKGMGARPISSRATRLDLLSNSREIVSDPVSPEVAKFLSNVFDGYSHIHALDLSDMTHTKGSPWDEVWNAPNGIVNVGMQISDELIIAWFSSKREFDLLH